MYFLVETKTLHSKDTNQSLMLRKLIQANGLLLVSVSNTNSKSNLELLTIRFPLYLSCFVINNIFV